MALEHGDFQDLADQPDWHLLQALDQTRAMLDRGDHDGEVWTRLSAEVDRLLDGLTGTTDDVSYVKATTGDRFERATGRDTDVQDRIRAALMALHDHPTDENARHAADALADLTLT